MDIFIHYKLSDRRSAQPLRRTLNFGRLFLVIMVALLYSHRLDFRPGLWGAFGIGLGVYIILRATIALGTATPAAMGWSQLMVARRDDWFPRFLFTVQSVYLLLSVAIFWLTLYDVGFPARAWHHAVVLILALSVPAYRIAHHRLLMEQNVKHDLAERFFRYLMVMMGAILLAGLSTPLFSLSQELRADDQLLFLLLIWSAALLVSVVCVLVFVDHWIRASRPAARPSKTDRPAGGIDNPRDAWGP